MLDKLACFLAKKRLLFFYRTIISYIDRTRKQKRNISIIFLYLGFLLQALAIHRTSEKKRGTSAFLCNISIRSETSRQLFAVVYLRWVASIFNHIPYNYPALTQQDFSTCTTFNLTCSISIWLNVNFMLLADIISDLY